MEKKMIALIEKQDLDGVLTQSMDGHLLCDRTRRPGSKGADLCRRFTAESDRTR